MAEPSITTGTLVAAGLTFFGVATGLDPALLLAGFAGGAWAQSYPAPMSIFRRASLTALASVLAAYSAPVIAAILPESLPHRAVELLSAVLVGFTAHRVLGPALLRFVSKKAEELAK